MKKIYILPFLLLTPLSYSKESTPISFTVQETQTHKKVSKNEIKEDIGYSLKSALHACSDLNEQAGKLQQELSQLQKKLLGTTENLVDNKRPFKKASRGNLNEALKTINTASATLKQQRTVLESLKTQMNSCACLKEQV